MRQIAMFSRFFSRSVSRWFYAAALCCVHRVAGTAANISSLLSLWQAGNGGSPERRIAKMRVSGRCPTFTSKHMQ